MGPAATQSGASLRGGADAGRIRTSSLRRRPPAPLGSPQASSAQAASSAATGAAGLNPGPRHLFTDADFPVLGGGGAAAPPPPPRAAPTAAAAEPPQAKADGPSSPNPLLEGDGSDARGASTLGGLGTPLAYRRDSSEELLAVWTAPSSGVSTPVQQHQQQQQLKKAKRRIRPTPILSTTGGGGGGLASGGMGAIEPVLSGGMSGGGLGDGDLTRLPNAPPILLPPPRGSSLPASALRPPTAEGAAAGAGAATAPDGGGSSLSFLTPVKRSSNVGCVPRPSAGPLDGSGGERCLSRPRAVATVAVLRSPLPVGANTIGGAADAGADDSDSPLTVVTTTRLPEALRERIGVVAGVYATILTLRLAPKLATELHLLARLLTVDESLVR